MIDCPFTKIHPSALQRNAEFYMSLAFNLAIDAWNQDEVPVGAVIVRKDEVISSAHNQTRSQTDPTAHAEMIAITMAAKKLGDWRLNDCQLYVTKEPCPMCSGATLTSRLGKVFFGLGDPKMGCLGGPQVFIYLKNPTTSQMLKVGSSSNPARPLFRPFFNCKGNKSPLDLDSNSDFVEWLLIYSTTLYYVTSTPFPPLLAQCFGAPH